MLRHIRNVFFDTTGSASNFNMDEIESAKLLNGGFVTVWADDDNNVSKSIQMQFFAPNGDEVGGSIQVNIDRGDPAEGDHRVPDIPQVAVLGDGRVVVVWHEQDEGGFTGSLWARVFNADGTPQGPDFVVEDSGTTLPQSTPTATAEPVMYDVVAVGAGSFMVSFRGRIDGGVDEVRQKTFTPGDSGDPNPGAETALIVSDGPNQFHRELKSVALPDGGYAVFWRVATNPPGDSIATTVELRVKFLGGSGTAADVVVRSQVEEHITTLERLDLAALPDGSLVVVWNELIVPAHISSQLVAFAALVRPDGTVVQLGHLGDTSATEQIVSYASRIASLPNGEFVIAFLGPGDEPFAQRFDGDGNKIDGEAPLGWPDTFFRASDEGEYDIVGLTATSFAVNYSDSTVTDGILRVFSTAPGGNGPDDGDSADNTLGGTDGNDTMPGYDGNDTLNGLDGDDTLDGGQHDDVLNGGPGFDTLIGGVDDDKLDGGSNPSNQGDFLLGGAGDDEYHVDSPLDFVDEGTFFPQFGSGGSDTGISTADFFWDLYSVFETFVISELASDPEGDGVTVVAGIFGNTIIGNSGTNIMFGRGGSDTYIPGDGIDWISLSTLGVTDENAYEGVDGSNTVIVTPRETGPFSYDIVFEFETGKDMLDVSTYGYASREEVFAKGVNVDFNGDGDFNDSDDSSYFILGDGLDYLYMVGTTLAEISQDDFFV